MNDDTIRLATVGRILRRRWRLLTVLALVGALLGYGASLLMPPQYTTTAQVLLTGGQWDSRGLLTQSEVAGSSVVLGRSADALGWPGTNAATLATKVTATATDGNILLITSTADTPKAAQQLADEVARQYVTYAAEIAGDNSGSAAQAQADALRQLVALTSRKITDLASGANPGQTVESVQSRTQLEQLRTDLESAMNKLDATGPTAAQANMVVMGSAAPPTGAAPPTRTQLVAGGALLFVLLAVIGHLAAARVGRRARTEDEITRALGAALLGEVDVPDDPELRRVGGSGPRAFLRRVLGTDVRWDVAVPQASGDEASRRIRLQRVCGRLREQLLTPRRLLVLVPDGDRTAARAAERLVAEGGDDPRLRLVQVSATRPVVPDRGAESGAVVVLSAGSWSAFELAGIAEACADAGHEVVGVVVAGPVRDRDRKKGTADPAPRTTGTNGPDGGGGQGSQNGQAGPNGQGSEFGEYARGGTA